MCYENQNQWRRVTMANRREGKMLMRTESEHKERVLKTRKLEWSKLWLALVLYMKVEKMALPFHTNDIAQWQKPLQSQIRVDT